MVQATASDPELQQVLITIAQQLGLSIETPFVLDLPCGSIHASALLKDFAYPNGILLVAHVNELGGLAKHLNDFGYGFACLPKTISSADFKLLCHQWQWTSDSSPPAWLAP